MRYNISKRHSTKQERIFHEVLKSQRIAFKHRWLIGNIEVDFLIGKVAIEIDGHPQDGSKNHKLAELGYTPIHLNNDEVTKENVLTLLTKLNGSIKLS